MVLQSWFSLQKKQRTGRHMKPKLPQGYDFESKHAGGNGEQSIFHLYLLGKAVMALGTATRSNLIAAGYIG